MSDAGEGALEDGADGVFDPCLRTVAARGEQSSSCSGGSDRANRFCTDHPCC